MSPTHRQLSGLEEKLEDGQMDKLVRFSIVREAMGMRMSCKHCRDS